MYPRSMGFTKSFPSFHCSCRRRDRLPPPSESSSGPFAGLGTRKLREGSLLLRRRRRSRCGRLPEWCHENAGSCCGSPPGVCRLYSRSMGFTQSFPPFRCSCRWGRTTPAAVRVQMLIRLRHPPPSTYLPPTAFPGISRATDLYSIMPL